MVIKMFVECRKSKGGNKFYLLQADLGYTIITVTMDRNVICPLCDITLAELFALDFGETIPVALNVTK